MLETMISEMDAIFCQGVFSERKVFRFNLEAETVTVVVDSDGCQVDRGGNAEPADCSCSTSIKMFGDIWYGRYRPGIIDFLGGAIRCDNPLLLPQFLRAFGKS